MFVSVACAFRFIEQLSTPDGAVHPVAKKQEHDGDEDGVVQKHQCKAFGLAGNPGTDLEGRADNGEREKGEEIHTATEPVEVSSTHERELEKDCRREDEHEDKPEGSIRDSNPVSALLFHDGV